MYDFLSSKDKLREVDKFQDSRTDIEKKREGYAPYLELHFDQSFHNLLPLDIPLRSIKSRSKTRENCLQDVQGSGAFTHRQKA